MPARGEQQRRARAGWALPVVTVGLAAAVAVIVLVLFPGPDAAPTPSQVAPGEPSERAPASTAAAGLPAVSPTPVPTPHPSRRGGTAWAVRGTEIYLAGGIAAGRRTNGVVAFDSRVWRDLPALPEPRVRAALGAFSDGTLLLAGGEVDGAPVDSTLFLAPDATEWTPGPPLPGPRGEPAYATVDDRLFLFGGSDGTALDSTLIYDHAAASWFDGARMPSAAVGASAAHDAGAVYLTGGTVDGAPSTATQRYDTATDSWTVLAAAPIPLASHASVAIDGRVWVVGPRNYTGVGFGQIPVYDIGADAWTLIEALNELGSGIGAAVMAQPGGSILVIDGQWGVGTLRTAG